MSRSRLVARNVLVTLATQLISWALTFAVTLYLPRYVGDAGLGKLAFAGSIVAIFGVFVPLGTSTVLVKEIARDRSRTGELLLAAMLLRVLLGVVMTGLAVATVHALGYPALTRTLVMLAAMGMVLGTFNDALGSALQGQENMPRQSVALILEKFLSSVLTIALILGEAPLWTLAAVGLFTATVSLLVNLTAFKTCLPTSRLPSRSTLRYLIVAGMPFFGIVFFRTVYNKVDVTLLSIMTNDVTVGWYMAAAQLLGATMFVPAALSAALLPTLTKLYAENETQFAGAMRRALAFALLCAIPIAVPMALLSNWILFDILHYPPAFRPSAIVLSIYGFGCILWYVTQIAGTALIVIDRQSVICRISLVAMVLTVGGCLVAIPATQRMFANGGIGVACVNVAVEMYMAAAIFLSLPRGLFTWNSGQQFLKTVVAVLPMILLVFCGPGGSYVWISIGAGVFIYLVLCYRFGCLDGQYIVMFKQALNRRQSA
jgi:O-antigen/teichoic acid export membrane protein